MSPRDIEGLFEAVREACPSAVWSRGVSLSRGDGVGIEDESEDELLLRVATTGRLVAELVHLFPEDEDWSCECPSAADVCEHVAAAVIALKKAQEEGRELGGEREAPGRVVYELRRESGGLVLERAIRRGDELTPLTASLIAIARGRADGPAALTVNEDLEIERILGGRRGGILPPGLIDRLLTPLARVEELRFEGKPIRVSNEPLRPRVLVEDAAGGGFRLRFPGDETIEARPARGLVIAGSVLRPVAESGLTGRELEEFKRGRVFGPESVGELVTEIIPGLERRVKVDLGGSRLPRATAQRPRLRLEARREDGGVSVLPLLVYGNPPSARVDGSRLVHLAGDVPLRDEQRERRLLAQLSRLGLVPGRRELLFGEDAVTLVRRLETVDADIAGEGLGDYALAAPLEVELALEGHHFDALFTSGSGGKDDRGGRAASSEVLAAWHRGASLVPLLEGGWAPLPLGWLAKHGERLADLLAARDAEGRVATAALPELAAFGKEHGLAPVNLPTGLARLGEELERPHTLPQDLDAELRPYQSEGVRWLGGLRDAELGALLADDMGLGKTLQTLASLEDQDSGGRSLVVCPRSLLHNWEAEAQRFRPGLRVARYHGPRRSLDPDAALTLTTYGVLRADTALLSETPWSAVVLDEAQAIKNPDSRAAQAAYELPARFRVALSGTPIENRLEELWSLMHFLNPGLLGNRQGFDERYARPIGAGDEDALARLRRRLGPFLLRRLKREVAPELPPRTEIVLHSVLDENERAVYDTIRAATRRELVDRLASGSGVFEALEALMRLRQAACHAALVPGQEAERSSKVTLLGERLEQMAADGHKALVFSQWTSLLDLIEPELRERGLEFLRLDGSTRDRERVVDGFQDEAGPPILLISLKAGGTGLNLTAADHVFLVDPWWNPAVEDQAADRAHRIGQDKPVFVHRLVAEDTVEERILALQEQKRSLAEAALGGAGKAASLTRDDLLELLA